MNTPKQGEDTTVVLFACAMIAVLFVLPAWYAAHMSGVNGAFLHLAKAQLWPFAALSDEAREALARIASTPPANVPWETVLKVLEYSGSWVRWPYLAILAALGTVGVVQSSFTCETALVAAQAVTRAVSKRENRAFPAKRRRRAVCF